MTHEIYVLHTPLLLTSTRRSSSSSETSAAPACCCCVVPGLLSCRMVSATSFLTSASTVVKRSGCTSSICTPCSNTKNNRRRSHAPRAKRLWKYPARLSKSVVKEEARCSKAVIGTSPPPPPSVLILSYRCDPMIILPPFSYEKCVSSCQMSYHRTTRHS